MTRPEALLGWLRPEPPTDYELGCMEALAPVDREIGAERLHLILAEGMEVFSRCSISDRTLAGDVAVGLYTAEGDLVDCNVGTYLHAVTSVLPIKYILRRLQNDPTVGLREGDIFFCNDALYGGIHNPDQILMMPIFWGGHLVAWGAAVAHTSETGATEPGGMPIMAKSRHDEGMKLPPIRIGERYRLRRDLLDMMVNFMSRSPRTFVIDLNARLSACDRVRVRVEELLRAQGPNFVAGLFRHLLVAAEAGARARIGQWNDGTYRAVVFTDTIGYAEGLQRTCLTVTKEGEGLTLDFTGTSPEHDGSYHAFPHTVVAHVATYMYGWAFHDLPCCTATLAPLQFRFPPGTVVNPSPEAACSNSVMVGSAVMSLLPQCFAKMMFDSPDRERITAAMGNTGSGSVIAGDTQWGVPVSDMIAYPLNTEGGGGGVDHDGVDAMGFPWCPGGRAPNVEDEEYTYPILCWTQKYARDSGGFGKQRGGTGTQITIVPHLVPHLVQMSISKNSRLHTVQGLFGGYPPRVIPGVCVRGTDLLERLAAGDPPPADIHDLLVERSLRGEYQFSTHARPTQVMARGDLWVEFASGGAGYGDVLERDPEAVLDDLRQQVISAWVAREVYRVDFDPDSLELDWHGGADRREAERSDRRRRGLPWPLFLKNWLVRQPPAAILKHYGRWPDAAAERPVIRT